MENGNTSYVGAEKYTQTSFIRQHDDAIGAQMSAEKSCSLSGEFEYITRRIIAQESIEFLLTQLAPSFFFITLRCDSLGVEEKRARDERAVE